MGIAISDMQMPDPVEEMERGMGPWMLFHHGIVRFGRGLHHLVICSILLQHAYLRFSIRPQI